MEFNQDEFLILLLRQLDNCTNWNEDQYIDHMLQKHEAARQLKQHVIETFPEETGRNPFFAAGYQPLDIPERSYPMPDAQTVISPQWKRRIRNIAASLLVAAATGATLFFFSSKRQPAVSSAATKGVVLQVAKGETVQLGDTTDTIPTKYALLNTNSAMLQFTVKPGSNGLQENTITVPATHMYSITLADGTVVHLNAATSLRFPFAFNGPNREVYIDGEAYFSVAPDPQQPFIVHTKRGDVKVLGTAFNINTYEHNFMVSLVSGSVAVSSNRGGKTAVLKPCKAAILDPLTREFAVVEFKSDFVLGWMQGQYRFQEQTLRDVCKVVERWYGVKIKFDSDQLAKLKYSGIINKRAPVETFLEYLKDNGRVDDYYTDEEGVIHLNWKGGSQVGRL